MLLTIQVIYQTLIHNPDLAKASDEFVRTQKAILFKI